MTRVDHEWGVELSLEPIKGIPLIARIMRLPSKEGFETQFTWDGTPTDEYATVADAAAFVNSLRVMLDEARGVVAELENRAKTTKKRSKTARK